MLKIEGADHQEANPDADIDFVSQLSCSLIGEEQTIFLSPGSLARRLYGKEAAKERFNCSYGLNEAYRDRLKTGPLRISGVDDEDNVRVVELSDHRFFIATLYLPQLSSSPDRPHPLILSYLKTVKDFQSHR